MSSGEKWIIAIGIWAMLTFFVCMYAFAWLACRDTSGGMFGTTICCAVEETFPFCDNEKEE